MTTSTNTPPSGTKTEILEPVESKQGTDKPKGMPIVLVVSTVGAFVLLFVIWSVFAS